MAVLASVILLLGAVSCFATPTRIIGGQLTTIDHYPSLVQVEYYDPWNRVWYQSCAASILTSKTLLSAAHCFSGLLYQASWRRVRAGTSFQSSGGQVSNVAREINHPTFSTDSTVADITVVVLQTQLIYSDVVQQATIITQDSVLPDNSPVVYAGWGRTVADDANSESYQLRDVTVFTINNQLCKDRYSDREEIVDENMICAGILDVGGKDSCKGDSGGPLYYGRLLVGVVSWGQSCADDHYPGVNTRVAAYTHWIRDNAEI